MEPVCVSVTETMRALGIGRTKVYELINVGLLKVVKIGRRTLVRTASIRALAGEGGTDAA
jgi:excisionase family DNA binding protein